MFQEPVVKFEKCWSVNTSQEVEDRIAVDTDKYSLKKNNL